jgi:hypothetical protein
MAKRRNRIVHEADLSKKTDSVPKPWTHVDDWQLIMRLLAVPAFFSLLCTSLDPKDEAARQRYGKLRKAMDRHVDFDWEFAAFSKSPPSELPELLNGLLKLMDSPKERRRVSR